jgi:hypothetical protein
LCQDANCRWLATSSSAVGELGLERRHAGRLEGETDAASAAALAT